MKGHLGGGGAMLKNLTRDTNGPPADYRCGCIHTARSNFRSFHHRNFFKGNTLSIRLLVGTACTQYSCGLWKPWFVFLQHPEKLAVLKGHWIPVVKPRYFLRHYSSFLVNSLHDLDEFVLGSFILMAQECGECVCRWLRDNKVFIGFQRVWQ